MSELSHTNDKGKANMVDVGSKPDQVRTASAQGRIFMKKETLRLIKENQLKKVMCLPSLKLQEFKAGKRPVN